MALVPIASFLAGAVLSLVLPVLLLIALVVWYMGFFRQVPETTEPELPRTGTDPKLDPPVDASAVTTSG